MRTIKRLTEADFNAFLRIRKNAYPAFKVVSEESALNYFRLVAGIPEIGLWGCFDGDEMSGQYRTYDFTMNVHGEPLLVGGLGGVAVDLGHKKDHVARDMVARFLGQYRDKGACMVCLYPFRPDFYRNMGFGHGNRVYQYVVNASDIRNDAAPRSVAVVEPEVLAEYYEHNARAHHGMFISRFWELEAFLRDRNRFAACTRDGEIKGFVGFEFVRFAPENPFCYDLLVNEFLYDDRDALAELMLFLRSQADQVRHLIINTPDENLFFHLDNISNVEHRLIFHECHETYAMGLGLMYRLVDPPKFFRLLPRHDFGGVTLRVKFDVHDDFFAPANGAFTVHFSEGTAEVADGGAHDVEVGMNAAEFSSLAMGCVPFRSLWEHKAAEVSDERCIEMLTRLFAPRHAPRCVTAF